MGHGKRAGGAEGRTTHQGPRRGAAPQAGTPAGEIVQFPYEFADRRRRPPREGEPGPVPDGVPPPPAGFHS